MPTVDANGLRIAYEILGDPADPPLLLVSGLGAQLVDWDDDFCAAIADRGFAVIRYDNRDTGLSTHFHGVAADIDGAVNDLLEGRPPRAPYLIDDMADDAAGLLDALGVAAAHVVGVSMGGMIAQALAIRHPARVRSLCSVSSTPGLIEAGAPTDEAMQVLGQPVAPDRDGYVEGEVRNHRVTGSPGFPSHEDRLRARAARAYDRGYYPEGVARQLVAVMASPDRAAALRGVRVPTVVIHGDADPLVTPGGGRATAEAVPGAELVMIGGMGHDLPPETWPTIIGAIEANARKAVTV